MRPDDVRRVLGQQPFRPFRIHLSNGRTHDVFHPDLVMVGKADMIVGTPAKDMPSTYEDYSVITLVHINELEMLPVPPAGANGPAQ